jgi:dihydroorotate dehydrogenase electron transfer subunit
MARLAKPGQFLHVKPSGSAPILLRRPFSINDVCGQKITILYRIAGKGTTHLASLKKGDPLKVLGPLGHGFKIDHHAKEHLIVAGGMGLAPMQFMARLLDGKGLKPWVYYGCGGKSDLLPCPGRKKILTTDDGSCGLKGYVTEALIESLNKYDRPSVYACGPWPMLKRTATLCLERGINCQVSLEAFMACGVGACQGCVVKGIKGYLTVCHDGPVFDAREIDWEQDIDL